MDSMPVQLDVYRTAIPMRSFEHAAASRDTAEAVVVRLELADGRVGWGETLPRPYVTGESIESVVTDLAEVLWPAYLHDPSAELPRNEGGRVMNAAACALELAHVDAVGASWALPSTDTPITARVSGVLGSAGPGVTARRIILMRLFGLKDFKLKLGLGGQRDRADLRTARRLLGGAIAAGRCTLRVDVNGAWDAESAPRRSEQLLRQGVCAVEQPTFCTAGELVALARLCPLPLIADESLVTDEDAQTLLAEPERIWWNIRISKNGGLRSALSLARLAAANGVTFVVGCMVGESGILSAAQRRLLQLAPKPRFVEGNYGSFLLGGDLVSRRVRMGYGGRLKPLPAPGLGVAVDHRAVSRFGQLLVTLQAGRSL